MVPASHLLKKSNDTSALGVIFKVEKTAPAVLLNPAGLLGMQLFQNDHLDCALPCGKGGGSNFL